jgi:hypothetical protein
VKQRSGKADEETSKNAVFSAMLLVVENPLVAACLDSLNQKSELRSEQYWVAKAKKNIARGNK